MNLPEEAVAEFREIYEREFEEEISLDKARELAESFMRLILLILRRLPTDQDDDTDTSNAAI